jgi:two-component system NtrC family response regulator
MILCPKELITVSDIPKEFKKNMDNTLHLDEIPANATLYETLDRVEQEMIIRAMRLANNVQSHAAQILGIGKSGLSQKIKKYDIDIESIT